MRVDDRNIDHIDADIGIGRISVVIGACLRVILRLLDLTLLDNFLVFDHAAAAVWAVVPAFLAPGAASRTAFIVFDLRAGDLFLGLLPRSEPGARSDPFREFDDQEDRENNEKAQENHYGNQGADYSPDPFGNGFFGINPCFGISAVLMIR